MTKFLRRLFIKDYDNIHDPSVRAKHGILAAFGGIVINLLLFGFKITIGVISLSMSIISDAINNLSDLFSCLVNLIGFRISAKPADKEHPFGHQRVEYIAGMIVSFVIIAIAITLGYSSISKLIAQDTNVQYSIWAFIVLGGGILFKLLLGFFYYGLGKAIDSVTLKASMQDSINDVICTSLVLATAIIQYFFNQLWWLDSAVSIAVALFILYSGIKMIKETAAPLIGLSPDSDFVKTIVNEIRSYKGVLGIHDLVVHSYGPTKTFVTVHVEVDGYGNFMETHDLIDNIEEDIESKFGVEITIHMDPIDTKNQEIPILKDKIRAILDSIDTRLMFHDLRLVAGPTHTNVLFDIVVPAEFKTGDTVLANLVSDKVKAIDKKYNCVIKIDHNYVD